jgi:imidazolonepropionase-like amidohydrolase
MNPKDALQAATSKSAEMMYVANRVGTIAPGKQADLIVLRNDPLQDLKNLSTIDAVILRGNLLTRERLDQLLQRAASESVQESKH